MVDDLEAVFAGDLLLASLDGLVVEFHHFAGLDADHVIVILFVDFVTRLLRAARAAVEHVLAHQVGRLELGQNAVNRGQTDLLPLIDERAVDFIGGHVLLLGRLEQPQNLKARMGYLQTRLAQLTGFLCHERPSPFNFAIVGRYCIIASMTYSRAIKGSIALLIVPALALAMAGCGLIYKQDIQQGNVLDADDVGELNEGMTKRQVQLLLGSPSVQSPFHADRWDYMNTYSRRGGSPEKRVLTLHFDDNRLIAMEGNYLDEEDLASQALEDLQEPDDQPIQDLDTLQQPDFDPEPGT